MSDTIILIVYRYIYNTKLIMNGAINTMYTDILKHKVLIINQIKKYAFIL